MTADSKTVLPVQHARTGANASRRKVLGLGLGAGVLALGVPALGQPSAKFGHATEVQAKYVPGSRITWALREEPPTLVPLNTTAGSVLEVSPKIVEGLLTYDVDLNPIPLLATSWEVSADGLHYVFKLREGVLFHDGTPFTSKDVQWSIQAVKESHPRGRITFANVQTIETPDAHTVVFVLSQPAPYLLTALASLETPIVPQHLYEGRDIASNPISKTPIGTGPFVFKEWVSGSHIILERNPHYWDSPRPYIDQLVARFIPEASARGAALEAGQLDYAGNALPFSDIARFEKIDRLHVDQGVWTYQGQHNLIVINFENPILQNLKVRQALSQALSVQEINKLAWFGKGLPTSTAIGVASPFHNKDIPFYAFDVQKAKALLDEAGYPVKPGGTRFELRLTGIPAAEKRILDLIKLQLGKVDIAVSIQTYDIGKYVKAVYTDRAFDLVVETQANMFDPTVGVQRIYLSSNFKVGLPFSNGGHYSNPAVDDLLHRAAVEVDQQQRKRLFAEFQQLVWDDVATINVGRPPQTVVTNRRVRDAWPSAERSYGSFAHLYVV